MLTSITFFQSSASMLSSSRYLQSELTTHEELNRVRNIFKDCRQILLSDEEIDADALNRWTKELSED